MTEILSPIAGSVWKIVVVVDTPICDDEEEHGL